MGTRTLGALRLGVTLLVLSPLLLPLVWAPSESKCLERGGWELGGGGLAWGGAQLWGGDARGSLQEPKPKAKLFGCSLPHFPPHVLWTPRSGAG